jgi:hypothetical protein
MGELCNPRGDGEKGGHFLLANRSFFLEILGRKYLPITLGLIYYPLEQR